MSDDNQLNESTIKDWMNKAGLDEHSSDFLQERKEKEDPEKDILEEEEKWSSEYQDKIEREMPDALYEMEGMEDEEEEMGGMEEPEMGDEMPDDDMGMEEEPEMGAEGGEAGVEEIVRAIADAISSTTGMQVDVEGEGGMEEPEMGDEMPDDDMGMEEPEMGDEMPPEDEDEVLEELVQGVMNGIAERNEE